MSIGVSVPPGEPAPASATPHHVEGCLGPDVLAILKMSGTALPLFTSGVCQPRSDFINIDNGWPFASWDYRMRFRTVQTSCLTPACF